MPLNWASAACSREASEAGAASGEDTLSAVTLRASTEEPLSFEFSFAASFLSLDAEITASWLALAS